MGLSLTGCSKASEPAPSESELGEQEAVQLDHEHPELVVLNSPAAVTDAFDAGTARYVRNQPFRQVGFSFSADVREHLESRVRFTDGHWSQWAPVEVTWQEGELHVGRVILDAEAIELELRGAAGLESAKIEFFEDVVARTEGLTSDLPLFERQQDGDFVTARQGLAPSSLVISRSGWGSRNTGRCGSSHNPYRMAIHHTYAPATDGGDPAARMRQMQAYHIDTNGWCDIGYHFVVSQSGKIYQGRSTEERTGAHVGGQNTGNIGICFIGNFQPGYATTRTPGSAQVSAAADIVGWVHRTYGIALNRQSVKGHREHAGQSTSCPGTNLLNKIPDILSQAEGGNEADYDISVEVNWLGTENFYDQGVSASLADALPNNTFKAEVLIKNKSTDVIRNVWAGYRVEEPYIAATSYKIESDYPALDGQTWTVNSADSADENPAKDQLGANGKLTMHAFTAGETKRILIDMEAKRYSIGAIDHPDVRGWIQHAEGRNATIFGDRDSWGDAVETNELGHAARSFAQMDVLDRNAWLFDDGSDPANLEGWTGKPADHFDELKINNDNMLAQKIIAGDARVIAPAWTSVPANTFDQLVLRVRSHDGPHTKAVFWARDDESLSEDRVVRFEAPGDGELHDLVIPMGTHEKWTDTVTKLRIDLLDGASPAADDNGWYDVDSIFFQSSSDQSTSAPGVEASQGTVVDLQDDSEDPGDTNNDPGGTNNDPGGTNNDPGGTNNDPGGTNNDPGGTNNGTGEDGKNLTDDGGDNVAVNEGCTATGTGGGPAGVAWLLLVGVIGLSQRRR
jgi:MYXO-CTERM domain-containing protein